MLPIVKSMLNGDKCSLARLMTYVDNRHEDLTRIMQSVYEHTGKAQIIGITGPPGAGKSTAVDKVIKIYRQKNKTVGVVCIDPSSPFTGGAVLGDRIRMMDHGSDDGVFIRSLGSRGSHGGLSRSTRDIIHLLDAYGFDVVIVETVGVGQTELDIMSVAHTTVVILVPESGDTIQTMKAGLMEIADIFAVNKSDREGADRIFAELLSLSQIYPASETGKKVPVIKIEALNNKGMDGLVKFINEHFQNRQKKSSDQKMTRFLTEECLDIFFGEMQTLLEVKMKKKGGLGKVYSDLIKKHQNPYKAAAEMMKKIKI